MKTYLVSSTLTFVPDNYENFIIDLAKSPLVHGLILIENRQFKNLIPFLKLILSGAAVSLGAIGIKNFFGFSTKRKKNAYLQQNKNFFLLKDINSEESIKILSRENLDLLVNARTRQIFRQKVLTLPKLGCLNIHHGLLPDQRGLMCDFWAHLENTDFGFSIHQMSATVDDGAYLNVTIVKKHKKSYLQSLMYSSTLEKTVLEEVLQKIQETGILYGQPNIPTKQTVYRKNPAAADFYKLKSMGIQI